MSDEPENLGNVRKMRQRALSLAPAAAAPPGDEEGQGEMIFLPGDCPVRPLGKGPAICYYLDELNQLITLHAHEHVRLRIEDLFGRRPELLELYWPRRKQDPDTKRWYTDGWRAEQGQRALMRSCAALGPWSPDDKERGPGAWRGPDGELVLHCGDELFIVSASPPPPLEKPWVAQRPGLIGDLVYPTCAANMKPHIEAQPAGPAASAQRLLSLLETWNWRRKDIDAYLLLGWIGSAMICGALEWRASVWLSGAKNTGKSTLQIAIKQLLGLGGVIDSADATASYVRQKGCKSTRPVAIDEGESSDNNRRMTELINLARVSASGAKAGRGSQDHTAKDFTLRSSFIFSSILIPPMEQEDLSRFAILELDAIEASGKAKPAGLNSRDMAELGRKLLRRLTQEWYRFEQTWNAYRAALESQGHDSRRQDGFGTLLAAADCLMWDGPPDEDRLSGWAAKLKGSILAEITSDTSDECPCLQFMTSTMLTHNQDREAQTCGEWITRAAGILEPGIDTEGWMRSDRANKFLSGFGIKVVQEHGEPFLAIANVHQGIAKIFQNTKWQSRPGTSGAWAQALRRLRGVETPKVPKWLGGGACRVTLVPLRYCREVIEAAEPLRDLPLDPRPPAEDDPPERGEF